ncbi:hypothetical protein [Hypericibacter sp.]|uniref:hypothetical protein n=1 Tax=Hypericibacter sp. TaxID=2705401 RepID=UPI003D6C98D9
MKLSVDGKVNAGPENRDIERAIDAAPAGASRHIHLQSNGDDFIEAVLEKDGRYRLSFVEDGERFQSADPVDPEKARTVLVEYLNQDSDWRRECRFVADESDETPSIDSARINAPPPVWAIILVAAAFFGFPLLSFLPV